MSKAHPRRGGAGGRSAPGQLARALAVLTVVVACATASSAARAQTPGARNAVVVEVAPPPFIGADGRLLGSARPALDRLTDALGAVDGLEVPLTLSISPVLVEQLRIAGTDGARAYAALLRAASRRPVLTRPFGDASLPGLGAAAARELEQGADALRRSLDAQPLPVLHPPGLHLDADVLRAAADHGLVTVLAAVGDIGTRAVTSDGVTLIPARAAPATGDLLQRPGRGTAEAVAVVVDVLDPRLATLASPATPPSALESLAAPALTANVRFGTTRGAPSSYTDAIRRATASVETFESYTLEDNRVRDVLEVVLGAARSSVHWQDRWGAGRDLAEAVSDRVSEERDLVFASEGSVTLTSQRGTVPVTVINRASYPVRVRVEVASPRLSFPDGTAKVLNVSPQGDTTTFVAQAATPGTFPLEVRVTSPDGELSFGSGEVLVRSVAARTPALVLTAGAGLFLLLWSLRALHRRRTRSR